MSATGVRSHELRPEISAVGERHADLIGSLDHVVVRHHDAVAPGRSRRTRSPRFAAARSAGERSSPTRCVAALVGYG